MIFDGTFMYGVTESQVTEPATTWRNVEGKCGKTNVRIFSGRTFSTEFQPI
jgi:hypothetical protein